MEKGEERGSRDGERALEPSAGTGPVTPEPHVCPAPLIPQGRSFFLHASGFRDSPSGRLSELLTPWKQIASCFCSRGFLCQWSPPPKPEYHQWELPPSCLMMPSSPYQHEATPFSLPCIFIKPSSFQACESQTQWEVIFLKNCNILQSTDKLFWSAWCLTQEIFN